MLGEWLVSCPVGKEESQSVVFRPRNFSESILVALLIWRRACTWFAANLLRSGADETHPGPSCSDPACSKLARLGQPSVRHRLVWCEWSHHLVLVSIECCFWKRVTNTDIDRPKDGRVQRSEFQYMAQCPNRTLFGKPSLHTPQRRWQVLESVQRFQNYVREIR